MISRTFPLLIALLTLTACGGAEPVPAPVAPAPVAPAADPHAMHQGGGMAAHMEVMAKTRDALRAELGAGYDAPVPGLDKADLAHGKAVYDQSCASCHGATGHGDGEAGKALKTPPSDLTDAFHARYYSDAGRVHLIKKGSAGTDMPAWEGTLDEKTIVDVYGYIAGLRGPG